MDSTLTKRQAAVLDAVRHRQPATLIDLRQDFPELAPSTVLRVLDALGRRGLVRRSGHPSRIYVGGVRFRVTGPAARARPRLYLNHIAEEDWLIALEFGRVDDGQDPEGWRMVGDAFGFLHDPDDGRDVGFKIVDFSAFDAETDDVREVWSGPRFDAPVLGLTDVPAGEIILAARALFGDQPTVNRQFFSAAINAERDDAIGLWLACLQSGDAMAHFGLGYTLYALGRYPEAYRHLRHYTEIAPHGPWPWCWLGKAAEAIGETDEARIAYMHAIELEDDGGEETDASELLDALEDTR